MAITKEKKTTVIQNIKESLEKSEAVVFVNFHGLSVKETTDLRKALRKENCNYKVAKKTLVKRVLADMKIEGEQPVLDGEVALSYGDDAIAPAKEVFSFAKTADEKIKIIGGILENKYLSGEEVVALAQIPPREVLYGQFVGTINAPVAGFVSVLDNTIASFVRTLGAIAQSK